jgi:hypothetical protein
MKKNLSAIYATLLAAIWAAAWFTAHAAQQTINLGTAPTGADGDTHRVAFGKVNANDTELYATKGNLAGGNTWTGTQAFGVVTATSVNGLTLTTSTGVVTIAAGKTLTLSNTLTFTGTDASTVAFGAGGTVLYSGGAGSFTTVVGSGSVTGLTLIPTGSTAPTNGMFLPAANTLGWGVNSAEEMRLTGTALSPGADGGNSLGTTTLGWQNLFGNTGFVFNIENGNWVATHTSGILTVGTGDLRVTTAGTNAASVVTLNGSQTLANKTLTAPVIGAATGTSLAATGLLHAFSATATPAGGTAGSGLRVGSTSNLGLFFGSGAPTLAAAQGSLYIRTDGAPYYNNNGTTGWTALTASVDQGGNYTWTGTHDYTTATVTFGTVTVGTITGTTLNMSGGSVRLPVAAGAATLASSGAVSYNTTNKQLGIHNGAKEVAVPTIMHVVKTFDPKAVCDGAVDRLFIMTTGVSEPFGITVVGWKVSFEADPTTEVDLDLKRADAVIGVANAAVMDVLDTTTGASAEATAANINGGAVVANGKTIYLEFGTAYTETTHQIIFEMWYEIEED